MSDRDHRDRLIVALDTPTLEDAGKLIRELHGIVTFYKIGFELFTAHGWKSVDLVRNAGGKVFLDLKLHDIPNTVAKTAAVICQHQVEIFNVHALGGLEMMKQVRETVNQKAAPGKKPRVIAVTVLTSHTEESLREELRIEHDLKGQVVHLAGLAASAGLDGVVSSPQEISLIRQHLGKDFLVVTPGIRGAGDALGDQKRTFSPLEAVQAGASHIVVGRPITASENPAREAEKIQTALG